MSSEEENKAAVRNDSVQYFSHPLLKPNKMERRRYQEVIAASCSTKNSLVVLPTGLGKTPIAILIAAHRLHKFPDSKVLVLAPTKPLVEQHRKTFEEFMNLPPDAFVVVTGKIKREKRAELWRKGKIIFATPQVVENDLLTGVLNLHNFSLVVFDEAHRAVGDYAYTHIARRYVEEAKNPLILGLTASPGGTAEKIGTICGNLFIENVEIKTEHDWDVRPYVARKEMEWVMVRLPEEFKKALKLLEAALRKRLETLRECGFVEVPSNPRKISKKVLLELQNRITKALDRGEGGAHLFSAAQANAMALKLLHAMELLQTQGVKPCYEFFRKLDSEKETRADELLLTDENVRGAIASLAWMIEHNIEHPKLNVLTRILQKEIGGADKKAIVFTQYVKTAELIVDHLKSKSENLRPVLFVGQRKGFTQKKQLEIMDAFRKGLYNVLVASSVAEEGLDIPKVDIVIFYEPIPSEIRSIQRRGRTGRFREGKIYILIGKGTMDEAFYWSAYHKEKRMMRYLQKLRRELKRASVKVSSAPPIFEMENKEMNVVGFNTTSVESQSVESNEKTTEVKKASLPVQMSLDNFLNTTTDITRDDEEKNAKNDGENSRKEDESADSMEKPKETNFYGKSEAKSGAPIIYADAREKKLIKILQEFGAEVRIKQIDVGDFQLSARVGVERKTAKDFVNSIVDGRLFNQLKNLAEAFEKPVLIIEGRDFGFRNVHPNAIRGAIASAVLDFGIATLFTEDERETALLLMALARREQEGGRSALGIRVKKQFKTLADLQEFIVAGLPGVNTKLARKLLEHFGSVRKVFMANEHELQKVEGIGKKKAREIARLLDAKYERRMEES